MEDVNRITTEFIRTVTMDNAVHVESNLNTVHEPKIFVEFGKFTIDGFTEQEFKQLRNR